jgi:hypothetical protein
MPTNLAAGWDIVVQYATNSCLLPEAHTFLQERLGDQYIASEWHGPLDCASEGNGDANAALAAINALRNKWAPDSPSDSCGAAMITIPDEESKVEEELMGLVAQLKARRCITGEPPTLEELLDPEEEREIGQSLDVSEGGDLEIVRMVQAKVGSARGDIIEINSDSDDSEPEVVPPSLKEMIEACRMLEDNTLHFCTEDALDFVQAAHQYRAHFQRMSREVTKQTTIDSFFNYK